MLTPGGLRFKVTGDQLHGAVDRGRDFLNAKTVLSYSGCGALSSRSATESSLPPSSFALACRAAQEAFTCMCAECLVQTGPGEGSTQLFTSFRRVRLNWSSSPRLLRD